MKPFLNHETEYYFLGIKINTKGTPFLKKFNVLHFPVEIFKLTFGQNTSSTSLITPHCCQFFLKNERLFF